MRLTFHSARTLAAAACLFGLAPSASAATEAPTGAPGEVLLRQRGCTTCHSMTAGRNLNGPSLAGVYGRPMGKMPGYRYSPGLSAAKGRWDAASLDRWLADPRMMVPGTKMAVKVLSAADRAALIAYLKTAQAR